MCQWETYSEDSMTQPRQKLRYNLVEVWKCTVFFNYYFWDLFLYVFLNTPSVCHIWVGASRVWDIRDCLKVDLQVGVSHPTWCQNSGPLREQQGFLYFLIFFSTPFLTETPYLSTHLILCAFFLSFKHPPTYIKTHKQKYNEIKKKQKQNLHHQHQDLSKLGSLEAVNVTKFL